MFFRAALIELLVAFAYVVPAATQPEYQELPELWVDRAPQTVQPYALEKFKGQTALLGNHAYRFSVTANSSGGAFSVIQNSAPRSEHLGTLAHYHKTYFEGFYCTRGRFITYAQTTPESEKQARLLTQGDFALVGAHTVHTYQVLDPDWQLTGMASPAGVERAFLATSNLTYDSAIGSPFPPMEVRTPQLDPRVLSTLASVDVNPVGANYSVPVGFDVNGRIGGPLAWHNGANDLPDGPNVTYAVARGWGPKYLLSDGGVYKIIAPLVTPRQSALEFHFGKLTLSRRLPNQTAVAVQYSHPTALQVEDGRLEVNVTGFRTISLIEGDLVFVPAGVLFSYAATAAYTTALYFTRGGEGTNLADDLLARGSPWNYTSYPQYPGYFDVKV